MQTVVVKGPKSRLAGASCKLCPHVVRPGQTVLVQHAPNRSYDEDRFVYHVECMAAVVDKAPKGVPALAPKARATAIKRRIEATGDLYGRPAA